jgi:hypothetical protein
MRKLLAALLAFASIASAQDYGNGPEPYAEFTHACVVEDCSDGVIRSPVRFRRLTLVYNIGYPLDAVQSDLRSSDPGWFHVIESNALGPQYVSVYVTVQRSNSVASMVFTDARGVETTIPIVVFTYGEGIDEPNEFPIPNAPINPRAE